MDPTSPKRSRKSEKSKNAEVEIEEAANDSPTQQTKQEKRRSRSKSPKSASRSARVESAASSSSSSALSCEWNSLPLELCIRILEGLSDDVQSLLSVGRVSLHWRQVATSEALWRSVFLRSFVRLEPMDEYFLNHGVPTLPLLSLSRKINDKKASKEKEPTGPSSFWHLFAHKWSTQRRWNATRMRTNLISPSVGTERFSMMVLWRGYCVTAGSDGRVCIWEHESFESKSSESPVSIKLPPHATSIAKEKAKAKILKELQLHEYHIWWMMIEGDLCFTVGSDGKFRVTNLEPLATQGADAEIETITVVSSAWSYWAIDVDPERRLCIIGSQVGTIVLLRWAEDDWRQWERLRNVKLGAGVWDLCLLQTDQFAACGYQNIAIYNFEPTDAEKREDEYNRENEQNNNQNTGLVSESKREKRTKYDFTIPPEFDIEPIKPITTSNNTETNNPVQATTSSAPSSPTAPAAASSSAPSASSSSSQSTSPPLPATTAPTASSSSISSATQTAEQNAVIASFDAPQRKSMMCRNLKWIGGLLIAAIVERGLEAWDVKTRELVWSISDADFDIFDVQQINNKLVVVGSDRSTGFAVVRVYDARTRQLLLAAEPDEQVGRIFSVCVTDESIYVCAVEAMLHIQFTQKSGKKDSKGCVIS